MLVWDDLTALEKEMATEQYISIREYEEGRNRDETTQDYIAPIDSTYVKTCKFQRNTDNTIEVLI